MSEKVAKEQAVLIAAPNAEFTLDIKNIEEARAIVQSAAERYKYLNKSILQAFVDAGLTPDEYDTALALNLLSAEYAKEKSRITKEYRADMAALVKTYEAKAVRYKSPLVLESTHTRETRTSQR
jgi:hypothetical protein